MVSFLASHQLGEQGSSTHPEPSSEKAEGQDTHLATHDPANLLQLSHCPERVAVKGELSSQEEEQEKSSLGLTIHLR